VLKKLNEKGITTSTLGGRFYLTCQMMLALCRCARPLNESVSGLG
jgi:hypothetical protein